MRLASFFEKSQKESPKKADCISASLLLRGQFIDQLGSGIYTLLPLGFRVHQKIENLIREQMDKINCRELLMPALGTKEIWQETKRWATIDPPLFKLKDRQGKELALNSTQEEIITDIIRRRVKSYKDLPFSIYQIQAKFRNEMRSTGGLLRTREFYMFDAYSFHISEEDRKKYYASMAEAYKKIYAQCELKPIMKKADPGTIGGKDSHEFLVKAKAGEDRVGGQPAIEVGHIFNLATDYSSKMKANFVDKDGKQKPIIMGSYGIGIGRLMATIVEVHHDQKGIFWPKKVAPYFIHLISLEPSVKKEAEKLYQYLMQKGIEVLYDDREETSAGEKFSDADLIGNPLRIVVSAKSLKRGGIEVKERKKTQIKIVPIKGLDKVIG